MGVARQETELEGHVSAWRWQETESEVACRWSAVRRLNPRVACGRGAAGD